MGLAFLRGFFVSNRAADSRQPKRKFSTEGPQRMVAEQRP